MAKTGSVHLTRFKSTEIGDIPAEWNMVQRREISEDYVIVHELLHMKIPDHGRGFQTALGCVLPDWREREIALGRWTVQHLQK